MNFTYLIDKFANDPLRIAGSIGIILLSLGIFLKSIESPAKIFIDILKDILSIAPKELKGQAGIAGLVNILIVISLACLSVLILIKSSIIGLFQDDIPVSNYVFTIIIFTLTAIAFIISLKIVAEKEKYLKFYKDDDN